MPLPIVLSRKLAVKLDELNTKETTLFGKDGKCQVSVKYENKDKPVASYSCCCVTTNKTRNQKRNL